MGHIRHTDEHHVVRWLSRVTWGYFALILCLLAVRSQGPSPGVLGRLDLPILVLPWGVGILLLAIWPAGPLKNWAVPWLMSLSFSMIVLEYGIALTRSWSSMLGPSLLVAGSLVVFPFAWYLQFLVRMSPRRCPGCGRTSLVLLMRVARQEKRSSNTRWCAGCGGKYWKDRHGAWQEERRTTWHDRKLSRGETTTVDPGISTPTQSPKAEVSRISSTTDA